jgi:hypothetical protein
MFKTILVIGAIAAAVFFGAKWLQKNPSAADPNRIAPPAVQLPGPQNPYGGNNGGGGNIVSVP